MTHEAEISLTGGDLRLDLDVPSGTCGICRMVPIAEKLDMSIFGPDGVKHFVTVCRHCLSEFAPSLLAVLEEDL